MKVLKQLTGAVVVAVGLAIGLASSASAAPIPFGSDLAATPNALLSTNQTYVNNAGGSGAVPAGYVAPADGLITGWRLKGAGAGGSVFKFHVVRGNTSVYIGPNVDTGTNDGISATLPESVLVKQGDLIGVTNDSGVLARAIFRGAVPGATIRGWNPKLNASETRAPEFPASAFSLLIQADLDSAASICGGVQATIAGTASADVILGTAGNDVIVALGGDDIIKGLGGNDIICGGDGKDKLKGGAGKDKCFGGPGKDVFKKCEKAKQN